MTRIFQAAFLKTNHELQLNESASHHLSRVLRAKINDEIILFNGEGGEYTAKILRIDKKNITVLVGEFNSREAESSLNLILAQGISRGEKMDYTIQKAVELGVKKIIPLLTERCNVKLDDDRKEKRVERWKDIIIGACEQCGRNRLPEIIEPMKFVDFLQKEKSPIKFILSPVTGEKINTIESNDEVVLLVGPEGGLSDLEIKQAIDKNFIPLQLGPRILRTETAAVAAITALQCSFGDMQINQ